MLVSVIIRDGGRVWSGHRCGRSYGRHGGRSIPPPISDFFRLLSSFGTSCITAPPAPRLGFAFGLAHFKVALALLDRVPLVDFGGMFSGSWLNSSEACSLGINHGESEA